MIKLLMKPARLLGVTASWIVRVPVTLAGSVVTLLWNPKKAKAKIVTMNERIRKSYSKIFDKK